jgi:Acyclic terpene utilisation family protein AtuA
VRDLVRIGAGSGFARDSATGVSQMLAHDPPDYLIFEQLAEQVMVNFLQEWQRSPDLGYSTALVDVNLGPYLGAISAVE